MPRKIIQRKLKDGTEVFDCSVAAPKAHAKARIYSAPFGSLELAKCWVLETESEVRNSNLGLPGGWIDPSARGIKTVGDLIDVYLDDVMRHELKESGWNNRESKLEYWRSEIGRLKLADLEAIELAIDRAEDARRKQGQSNNTLANMRGALTRVFRMGRMKLRLPVLANFTLRLEPVGAGRKRGHEMVLTDGQLRRLLHEIEHGGKPSSAELFLFARIVIATGARVNEVAAMRWNDIDRERMAVTFPYRKNGNPLTCALSIQLDTILADARRADPFGNGRIFPHGFRKGMRKQWNRACERADLGASWVAEVIARGGFQGAGRKPRRYPPHGLRHRAASEMRAAGASVEAIGQQLGQIDPRVTLDYIHSPDLTGDGSRILADINAKVGL